MFPIQKSPKISKKFVCKTCDYTCCKQSEYNKHISTNKHKNLQNPTITDTNPKVYMCKCGKKYKHSSTMYTHKKMCGYHENIVIDSTNANLTSIPTDQVYLAEKMIELVMSKNQEFMNMFMDKIVHILPSITNNSNSHNTNHNNFNIQMFLNEQCKNAMNLTDFIDSLPITAVTYDSTIENGLTKTITNMLVNGLNQLDILVRPIHCTDASRQTLYVKDDNIWEKDTELRHIMKGIKDLSLKQRTMINKWQDANMGWDTKENLQSRMTKLIFNSMTSIENDNKETGKIIRAISKNVYLDNDTRDQYIQLN